MASNNKNSKNPETQFEEVAISILPSTNEQSVQMGSQELPNISCPTPEISKSIPQSLLTRRTTTLKRKPKSRFGEPSVPLELEILDNLGSRKFERRGVDLQSPNSSSARSSFHATPRAKKNGEKETGNPDEYEIYKRVNAQLSARKFRKVTIKLVLELFAFLAILGCLVASLIVDTLKGKVLFGIGLWKWFTLLIVIFSGLFVIYWVVHCIVFLIEWKFLLKKNVVYFTHGLKQSVVVFIWLGVVLGTWILLFRPDVERIHKTKKMIDFLSWTLVSLFIGSFLWLINTTLIKLLASSFHCDRFFDRIQESVFYHYVLQTLAGRPVVELGCVKNSRDERHESEVRLSEHIGAHKEKKVVDWEKLHGMKKEKVPSWTMQLLADVVLNSGFTTISGLLNKDVVEGGIQLDDDEITSQEEAITMAVGIFRNIVGDHENRFIDKNDLLKFMIKEEVDLVYPLFEFDEKERISFKAFCKWVVKVYKDREALQHALNDNKTAVKQLNQLLTGILIVLTIVLWLLLTEIATLKIVLFFSSQLLVAAFIFGNTCRTIFEAIIFVFVMHPFDVGDRCLIDGMPMVVEEMNILTTIFLKADNEKVYYPNSVLATKPIGNYYRSPEQGDAFEFSIDYTTPLSTIALLRESIKKYLEKNKSLWHLDHNLVVKEIENLNKIKMVLFFNHTMNFQDFSEKTRRRSQLVLEMKTIFDDLQIKYHLLPQEIHLCSL